MTLLDYTTSHQQHIPAFPPELVDYTVDFLHDDRLSLRACASVSHSFLRSARYHLFCRLRIRDEPEVHGGRGYINFLLFLKRTPEVHSCIRKLRFVQSRQDEHAPPPQICPHVLGDILSFLPHLCDLSLGKGIYLACYSPEPSWTDRPDLLKFRLQNLSLASMRITTAKQLLELLRLFSHVNCLTISDVYILDTLQQTRTTRTTTGSLCKQAQSVLNSWLEVGSLVLDIAHAYSSFEALLTLLSYQLDFHSLISVTLGLNYQSQIKPMGSLLSMGSETIKDLTLRLQVSPHSEVPRTCFVSSCSGSVTHRNYLFTLSTSMEPSSAVGPQTASDFVVNRRTPEASGGGSRGCFW